LNGIEELNRQDARSAKEMQRRGRDRERWGRREEIFVSENLMD
jgi:hypothetical protein